jgi:glycosyltransferase involved in cell wall biosynthesis
MKVSLIVSTLNRPEKLTELLRSLVTQTVRPHKIVIVDQSDENLTEEVTESFADDLSIFYFRQQARGLSRGRNEGLKHIDGDIVAFPDDDCVYPPATIEKVLGAFTTNPELAIYTGKSISKGGTPSQGRWARSTHEINQYNIWISQTSYTTFYRASVLRALGEFDESLGVGSGTKWGAGEETELMLRALKMGAIGRYDPKLVVVHPEPLAIYDSKALARGKKYNRGFGRVLRIGRYPIWFVAYMIGRPLIGAALAVVSCNINKGRYQLGASVQRALGFIDSIEKEGMSEPL